MTAVAFRVRILASPAVLTDNIMEMRGARRQITILLFLSFTLGMCLALTPTTCVAPACDLGRPTTVTCYFHQDLWITKHEILVKHYPTTSSPSDQGEDVLFCYWKLDSQKHHCMPENGYQFDDNITDRLVLTIPSAAKENEGQYACHIIPPDNTVVYRCRLNVQEQEVLPSSTAHPKSTPGTDGNAGCLLSAEKSSLLVALGVSIAVAWVLCATCGVVRSLYRRGDVWKANYGRSSGEGSEHIRMLGDEEDQPTFSFRTGSAITRI